MGINLSLDLDYEFADKITVVNLKDSYERLSEDIDALKAVKEREPFQEEDFIEYKKSRKAVKKVLKYFMTHEEAKEYFSER